MNKQEKYINYIVEDLISKTKVDGEKKKIKSPFSSFFVTPSLSTDSHSLSPPFLFSNYVKEMYGTRDEELLIILNLYKIRLQTLINE